MSTHRCSTRRRRPVQLAAFLLIISFSAACASETVVYLGSKPTRRTPSAGQPDLEAAAKPKAPADVLAPREASMDQLAASAVDFDEMQLRAINDLGQLPPDRIDLALCVKGLEGSLATGQAGLGGSGRAPVSRYVDPNLDLSVAPSSTKPPRYHPNLSTELLVSAYGQSGRPYKQGGRSPQAGFDGAGLVGWVYAQQNFKLPQGASEMVSKGYAVGRDELRPGDILVYRLPSSKEYVLGLYSGNGNFIHASNKFGVVTETAAFGSDFGPHFLGGRRYIDDPMAAPLSDDVKTAVANGAVKTALLALGDSGPKPANIYGQTKKPRKPPARRKPARRSSSRRRG
ncbi:MAG: C40 family peptidase [Deltaproteobacteria bacterium]|jgi:cell wall-associated NlpC family hydrolase|nr:C40 family peptidase [Deltaproteobacteria bacterium]